MAMDERADRNPPKDDLIRAIIPQSADIEVRSEGDDTPVMRGHFAVFNEFTEINSVFEGHFLERIAPTAFDKTFQENRDNIKVLFQHGHDPQIGDKVLGKPAVLESDKIGARYEVPLYDTSYNRDLIPGLKDGAYGASFRFKVVREEFDKKPERSDYNPEGLPERTITEAKVMEFGPVTFPAYDSATAAVRSLRPEDLRRTVPVETVQERNDEIPSETVAKVSEETPDAPSHPSEDPERRDTQPEPDEQPEKEKRKMAGLEELRAELVEVDNDIRDLAAESVGEVFDSETQARFDDLKRRRSELASRIKATEERQAYVREVLDADKDDKFGRVESEDTVTHRNVKRKYDKSPENPFDMAEYHSRANSREHLNEMFTDGARRAIESMDFPHDRAEEAEAKRSIEKLVLRDDQFKEVALRVLITGSPTYRAAFWKSSLGKPLSREETAALAAGEQFKDRDMTTANTGGVTVPINIDPTVLPTSNGVINPFRQLSRIVTTTSYIWQGVTSPGVTAHYRAEAAVMTDDTPTLVARPIQPERADVFIPYSWEAGADWRGLEADMAGLIQDAKDALESTKFAVGAGHGSNEPQGLLVGAGTVVGTSGATALGVADVYALFDALPPRYQPNASLLAAPSTLSKIRQLVAASGPAQWGDSLAQGNPPQLLGYPAYKASSVGTAGSALTSTARWAVAGDFSRYVIVDRVGLSIRVISDLFGGTAAVHYPTGQSGLVAYWRNSAGVIDSNAFRVGTIT